MRKKQYKIAALLMALMLCLSACSGGKQEAVEQTPAPAAEVKPAAKVSITLGEDPSSGYQWRYVMDTPGILKESSNASQAQGEGTGGAHTWVFEAEGPGTVEVRFEFKQEEAGEAAETIAYTFRVNEDKGITLESSFGSISEIPQPQMQ